MRRFHLIGETRVREIERVSSEAAAQWCRRWFVPDAVPLPDARLNVLNTAQLQAASYIEYKFDSLPLWVCCDKDAEEKLLGMFLGRTFRSGELRNVGQAKVCQQIFEKLVADLFGILLTGRKVAWSEAAEPKPLPEGLGVPGMGTCSLEIRLSGDLKLKSVLIGDVLDAMKFHEYPSAEYPSAVSGPAALVSRRQATLGAPMTIQVTTRGSTFSVEELRRLSPGDVLELDHSIFDPLNVRIVNGPNVGNCYLGAFASTRAIQVVGDGRRARKS